MLDIPAKQTGAGIFDIAKKLVQKSTSSALRKKVLSSATTSNLKRAADSAIGQELKKQVLSGVAKGTQNATESEFAQLGLPKKKRIKLSKKEESKGIVLD